MTKLEIQTRVQAALNLLDPDSLARPLLSDLFYDLGSDHFNDLCGDVADKAHASGSKLSSVVIEISADTSKLDAALDRSRAKVAEMAEMLARLASTSKLDADADRLQAKADFYEQQLRLGVIDPKDLLR